MSSLSRRSFVGCSAFLALAGSARLSIAGRRDAAEDPLLVLTLLRGGLDGLSALPAIGDPQFVAARGALADFGAPALPLDGLFALHPNLRELHAMYGRGELLALHALGLPYRERSHFDAQQLLESGASRPHELDTGWLGRTLASTGKQGLALGTTVPLVLRGQAVVDTWAPPARPKRALDPASDLLPRLESLYRGDAALGQALARARELHVPGSMPPGAGTGAAEPHPARDEVVALAHKAGELLAQPRGPQAAVIEISGWDSHVGQVAPDGALARRLRTLDAAMAALRDALNSGPEPTAWQRTVVMVVTEFGRTVAVNGTGGTDHGSGGAAFLLGGALRGGRVIADWPGLAERDRFEGRDLRSTTDLRRVFASVLGDHLRVPRGTLDRQLIPGAASWPALDLWRG